MKKMPKFSPVICCCGLCVKVGRILGVCKSLQCLQGFGKVNCFAYSVLSRSSTCMRRLLRRIISAKSLGSTGRLSRAFK